MKESESQNPVFFDDARAILVFHSFLEQIFSGDVLLIKFKACDLISYFEAEYLVDLDRTSPHVDYYTTTIIIWRIRSNFGAVEPHLLNMPKINIFGALLVVSGIFKSYAYIWAYAPHLIVIGP